VQEFHALDAGAVERRHTGGIWKTPGMYLFQLLAMSGWTSLPWLSSLRQPTLVLMGRDDPLVPLLNGRILARLIPNARLQMIEDGHLFMVTRPVETSATIEAFLGDR
jgi:pimeloyl-ACP methyl ester carboxylesterase